MSISKTIQSLLSNQAKSSNITNQFSSSIRTTANILRNNSATCRCGDITIPTEKVGCLYKCIRCDKTYFATNYNLGRRQSPNTLVISPKDSGKIINMDYYDDAVKLLKEESKSQGLYHYLQNYRYYLTKRS